MGKKATTITLSSDDRAYLEEQTRARTIQAQTVMRAKILLLKADGLSIDAIADKVDLNRKSVMLCINKYLEGGVENGDPYLRSYTSSESYSSYHCYTYCRFPL